MEHIDPSVTHSIWTSNEKLTLAVAIFALIISIILGIIQVNISKKQVAIDQKLEKFESQKGEVQLVSLITRYIISFANAWDKSNPKIAYIKTDIVSVSQYLAECNSILDDLNSLINNPFYVKIVEKYPEVIKTIVQFRRDITEQEIKSKQDITAFSLNSEIFNEFYNLFYIIKNESMDSEIFSSQLIIKLEEIMKNLRESNPALRNK